jgi:tetratricopeptide (TPR) repeat protein
MRAIQLDPHEPLYYELLKSWLANNPQDQYTRQEIHGELKVHLASISKFRNPQVYSRLSSIFDELGDNPTSVRMLEQYFTIDKSVDTYSQLASAYLAAQDTHKAITLYEQAVTEWPREYAAYKNLATAYSTLTQDAESIEMVYSKALDNALEVDAAYQDAISYFLAQGNSRKSIAILEQAKDNPLLTLKLGEAWPYNQLGTLYLQQAGEQMLSGN